MASRSEASTSDDVKAGVQKTVDKETEQGYRGVAVDETPNSAYTVKGVTAR